MGYVIVIVGWFAGRTGRERMADGARLVVFGVAFVGTVFSIYLTFLEPFVIGATCAWCLTSSLVITALLWLTAGPGTEGEGWQGPDWSLSVDYDTPYRSSRYLAIAFSGYEYTGGAHGMPLILPLVIDLSTGRTIPPDGLFKPGSDWLGQLSQRCFSQLKGRDLLGNDEEWLREGTAPKLENFSLLFPGPDGLTVTFAPYSVAPYAAGTQEVLIPYKDLAGVLNPEVFGQ